MQESDQQKNTKIKLLLTEKFSKKYNIPTNNYYLNVVIERFVKNGDISTENLRLLDSLLKQELSKRDTKPTNRRTQSMGQTLGVKRLPNLDDDNKSVKSNMSGISNLSKFGHTKNMKYKELKDFYDLDKISVSSTTSSRKRPVSRGSNDTEDDWVNIINYNNKTFKDEIQKEVIKDKLMKQRTKNDLDFQVIDKFNKIENEKKKKDEFDNITFRHTQLMKNMDEEQKRATREKYLQEKIRRDLQLRDNKIQKKKAKVLEQRRDQEVIQNIIKENEKVKQMAIDKKIKEKLAFQKVMEDNENYKIIAKEHHEKIIQEEKDFTNEAMRIIDQQDRDRIEYNKTRMRNANSIDPEIVAQKKKELADKLAEDENLMNKFKEELEKK